MRCKSNARRAKETFRQRAGFLTAAAVGRLEGGGGGIRKSEGGVQRDPGMKNDRIMET
jgi:hypothetical protein